MQELDHQQEFSAAKNLCETTCQWRTPCTSWLETWMNHITTGYVFWYIICLNQKKSHQKKMVNNIMPPFRPFPYLNSSIFSIPATILRFTVMRAQKTKKFISQKCAEWVARGMMPILDLFVGVSYGGEFPKWWYVLTPPTGHSLWRIHQMTWVKMFISLWV